ncbi:anti-sigma-F factor Fin [Pontibacillus salicampi]|uniref:Anti-sigma-F factor Fin n=1 Tax=Pontibacillus salicampi TaxID=1449801 RepID=A0ABV6LTD1_9BACI
MAVVYRCRHCKQHMAEIGHEQATSHELGIHQLTDQERLEMIRYHENGDIQVETICEHCQEAMENNPHYHELDSFLQ